MEALELSEDMVYRRLRVLRAMGLVSYARPHHDEPGVYVITAAGLGYISSALPAPRLDLRTHRHDLLVVDVCQEIARERPDLDLCTERLMRSWDRRQDPDRPDRWLGMRFPGHAPSGMPRMHYPDATFLDAGRRQRIAVEVELTLKGRRRLERIVRSYWRGLDLEQILYVTDRQDVARAVRRAAGAAGAGGRLEVRMLDRGQLGTAVGHSAGG